MIENGFLFHFDLYILHKRITLIRRLGERCEVRIVDIEHLQGGEIIGKDIIHHNGSILLKEQTKYRKAFKSKLLEMNIHSIYIDDLVSKGIKPQSLISEERKTELLGELGKVVEEIKDSTILKTDNITQLAERLLGDLQHKHLMYDIMDIRRNDSDLYEHCLGVALLAGILSKKLGIRIEIIRDIVAGALIHDIGKLLIPKEIRTKFLGANAMENNDLKRHPEIGYEIIKDNVMISAITKVIVLCHHEREDGSGYPLQKKHDLHVGAKIVACCDVFNTLTSQSPNQAGMELNQVLIMLRKEPLSIPIREVLESMIAFYPIGTVLLLSNGTIGIVEKNVPADLKRPQVRIVKSLLPLEKVNYKLNLFDTPSVKIIERLGNL